MSYDEAGADKTAALWKNALTAKNGNRFLPYMDLPEGSYIKSQLRLEDGSQVTIGDFRYVLRIFNNGREPLVFQNPIRKSNSTTTTTQPPQQQQQQQQQFDEIMMGIRRLEAHILGLRSDLTKDQTHS